MLRALQDWKESPNAVSAMEVADAASLIGFSDDAAPALAYLKKTGFAVAGTNFSIVSTSNSNQTPMNMSGASIRRIRAKIRLQPRDALAHVDLAREYTVLGLSERAERSMTTALSLARNDRFVLRSAVRLFSHLGDLERAYDVVRKSEVVRSDPWVMAAEVATADLLGKSPKWGLSALTGLLNRHKLNISQSELASGLATLEAKWGGHKKAKRLFEKSLEVPTDNSLAQAAWMRVSKGDAEIDYTTNTSIQPAFEAGVLQAVQYRNYTAADWNAQRWLDDEPFSLRAASHGSYINSMYRRDYDRALVFVERGLVANSNDRGLLNNKAFALLQAHRILEAAPLVPNPYRCEDGSAGVAFDLALNGIYNFKIRNFALGRKFYEDSVRYSRRISPELAFNAAIHWLEQEVFSGQLPASESMTLVGHMDEQISKIRTRIRSADHLWEALKVPLLAEIARQVMANVESEQSADVLSDELVAEIMTH